MLNSDGKMATPLEVAKAQDSSACVFIIPVAFIAFNYS